MHMDENGLYTIYGTWHIPFWQRPLFFWTIILTLVLIFCAFSFFAIKHIRSRKKRAIPTNWQIAFQELLERVEQKKISAEDYHYLYGTISFLLKNHLSSLYKTDLTTKTDEEIISFLKAQNPLHEDETNLIKLFKTGNFAKFAATPILQSECEQDAQFCLSYIKTHEIKQSYD